MSMLRACYVTTVILLGLMLAACAESVAQNEDNPFALMQRLTASQAIPWQRQLPNASLPGWPVEHKGFLLVQSTDYTLYALRKHDGQLLWWLSLDCELLVGGTVDYINNIIPLVCPDRLMGVPLDISKRVHHKKNNQRNKVLWEKKAPDGSKWIAPALVRAAQSIVVVDDQWKINLHNVKDGKPIFRTDFSVCPVDQGVDLPLYTSKVPPHPLFACILHKKQVGNETIETVAMAALNGETGRVEREFWGPDVPLPTAAPDHHPITPAPRHPHAPLPKIVVEEESTRKVPQPPSPPSPPKVDFKPIITTATPILELAEAEDPVDSQVKEHRRDQATIVWLLRSTNTAPVQDVLAVVDEIKEAPKHHGDVVGDRPDTPAPPKSVIRVRYHPVPQDLAILGLQGATKAAKREYMAMADFFVLVRTRGGQNTQAVHVMDSTDMENSPKVSIPLSSEYDASGTHVQLGTPHQMAFDTDSLLVLQPVENPSHNASLPAAVLTGYSFDLAKNSSHQNFMNPLAMDFSDKMNVNANIGAVPSANGVNFINVTSGDPQWPLPLVRTKGTISNILVDTDFFFFGASTYIFGIPRFF